MFGWDNIDNRLTCIFNTSTIYIFSSYCSAGVGRSGCFILIDAMLERIDQESTVDVFNYLRYMRTRRVNMVQTFVSSPLLYQWLG